MDEPNEQSELPLKREWVYPKAAIGMKGHVILYRGPGLEHSARAIRIWEKAGPDGRPNYRALEYQHEIMVESGYYQVPRQDISRQD